MTYLEQGKPIIGIVENHSQIAKDIDTVIVDMLLGIEKKKI